MMQPLVTCAHDLLESRQGPGSDFLGWINLPTDYDKEEFARIKEAAKRIQSNTDIFIVIGIGGSYLGARAAIEFLKSDNYNALKKDTPDIYYAGNNISSAALTELVSICEGKDISINMISKSGTTTEPAIAFRVFREILEKKYGKEEAKKRIYCTTDKAKGTLKHLADTEGYETFVVPDDVGGRFSVLTAVGLLPIAVAGCDIDALMAGARKAQEMYNDPDMEKNDCYKYVCGIEDHVIDQRTEARGGAAQPGAQQNAGQSTENITQMERGGITDGNGDDHTDVGGHTYQSSHQRGKNDSFGCEFGFHGEASLSFMDLSYHKLAIITVPNMKDKIRPG